MGSAADEGRTIVFISHNIAAIRGLCDRAIMLSGGRIQTSGTVNDVVESYVGDILSESKRTLAERANRVGNGRLRYTDLRLEKGGEVIDSPVTGENFDVIVRFETADGKPLSNVNFGVSITAQGDEKPMLNLYSETTGDRFDHVPPRGEIRCHVDRCPLPGGQYFIDCWCDIRQQMLDALHRASDLTIAGGDFYESGHEQMGHRTVLVDHSWDLVEVPSDEGAGSSDRSALPVN
jgi:lipopolysaccharide transport system ATP-binding protein